MSKVGYVSKDCVVSTLFTHNNLNKLDLMDGFI